MKNKKEKLSIIPTPKFSPGNICYILTSDGVHKMRVTSVHWDEDKVSYMLQSTTSNWCPTVDGSKIFKTKQELIDSI